MEIVFTKKDLAAPHVNKKLSEIDAFCFLSRFREAILVADKVTYYHTDTVDLKIDFLIDTPFKIIKNRYN